MTPELMTLIIALLAVGIAGYSLWQANSLGTRPTAQSAMSAWQAAMPMATELADVASIGVQAAEQLWRDKKIADVERFDLAFSHIQSWFPEDKFPDLTADQIRMALESSVLLVNSLVDTLPEPEQGPFDTTSQKGFYP